MQYKVAIRLVLALGSVLFGPAHLADASKERGDDLEISIDRASVAPDGTTAGAVTDFVLTFKDIDPKVDGIGLMTGGTIRVILPSEFVNTGSLPFDSIGSSTECAPPKVEGCNTGVILQGWTQSPVPPFPGVDFDDNRNSLVLTAQADWMPAGVESPGPKQVHFFGFGFRNPTRPGRYEISVEIRPDPSSTSVLEGSGVINIVKRNRANINPNSQANASPPPPWPNTLFQTVEAGESSLTFAFYLWDRRGRPIVGADIRMRNPRFGDIIDVHGRRIGRVRFSQLPMGARNHVLTTGGPSVQALAFATGIPTGRLTAILQTDGGVTGRYVVRFRMKGGNVLKHVIEAV